MAGKEPLNWRLPVCGGKVVHGTSECKETGKWNMWSCKCKVKPINFNYYVHYLLAQAINNKKMHLDKNCESWNKFALELFLTGSLVNYQQVQGKTIKDRFFSHMINGTKSRHALGSAAGWETHNEVSPYDSLMLKMISDIEAVEAKKQYENEKKQQKQSSMLGHEEAHCPVVTRNQATPKVVDEEGDELINYTDDSSVETSPLTVSTSAKTNKKRSRSSLTSDDFDLEKIVKLLQPSPEQLAMEREMIEIRKKEAENQSNMWKYLMSQMSTPTINSKSSNDV